MPNFDKEAGFQMETKELRNTSTMTQNLPLQINLQGVAKSTNKMVPSATETMPTSF